MNSLTMKIIAFLLSVFVILTVSSQVYFAITDDESSIYAQAYVVEDSICFDGVFVRNEKVINSQNTGTLRYVNSDGSKLASNSVIANVYSSESDITNLAKIESLRKQLKLYERVTSQGTIQHAQPEFLKEQIDTSYNELNRYLQDKDYLNAEIKEQEINSLMCIYNVSVGLEKIEDYEVKKNEINLQITQLQGQIKQPLSVITTDESGYFVSYTDGYEDILSISNIDKITEEQINSITSVEVAKNYDYIGKIIDGYRWNIIGIVDAFDKKGINDTVRIRIGEDDDIIGKIKGIQKLDNGKCKINIECEVLNYNLVQSRTGRVEIIFNKYDGIRVPRNAINFKNGERGVYIVCGQEISFKKLEVIYEGGDYVLSKFMADKKYIAVHDQIVFEGDGNFGKS